MRSQHEEDEMPRSPHRRSRVPAVLALVVLLGSLSLVGCGDPATIPPIPRRRTADPVQKVRRGIDPAKVKNPAAGPAEPGKLPPGRGRAID
jgi:hypothetical protein